MAKAKTGDKVRVHYTGKLDDGTVFDSSRDRQPLEFVLGDGQVIAGFEQGVLGMEVGERRQIRIPFAQAYGARDEDASWKIPRVDLPKTLVPQVGMVLQTKNHDDRPIRLHVTAVSPIDVTVDTNHPLAGKDLTFDLERVAND